MLPVLTYLILAIPLWGKALLIDYTDEETKAQRSYVIITGIKIIYAFPYSIYPQNWQLGTVI